MDCSEYHIHGWDRLKPEVWAVIAVTALASGVSETAVKMLMDDDRVMMTGWLIHEAVAAELEYVNAMSPKILELICQALPWSYHLTPCELHSRVLHVSYISSAFLDKKVFKRHTAATQKFAEKPLDDLLSLWERARRFAILILEPLCGFRRVRLHGS